MERRRFRRGPAVGGMAAIRSSWIGRLLSRERTDSVFHLVDIGEEGLCLYARNPQDALGIGETVALRIKAPKLLEFQARGRIAWERPARVGERDVWLAGVEFEDLNAKDRAAIKSLLRRMAVLNVRGGRAAL